MTGGVVDDGEDRIGALPDDLLRRVLSFLPSRQSVRTCVLARRWRNLWKSVPAVRVDQGDTAWFVSSLLLLRDRAPLHLVEIMSPDRDQEPRDAELWLQYAASCHVQVLRCAFRVFLLLPNMTLVCQHLTRLQVSGMTFRDRTLDFSSCPVLAVLEMQYCGIAAERILCQSLRHLSMEGCFFPLSVRTRISCPSLHVLILVANMGLTPFLESMPSLVTAFVRLEEDGEDGYDHCYNGGYYGACDDESCLACDQIDSECNECVLLHGLSGAADLTLKSAPEMIICTRDFKWRHMFSKLKTLYLNEWCLAADFGGLVYFLQQSPILERLTILLEICKEQPMDRKDETYKRRKQLLISKNLKVVEIEHHSRQNVEILFSLVKILRNLGVPRKHIKASVSSRISFGWHTVSWFYRPYFPESGPARSLFSTYQDRVPVPLPFV